MKVRVTKITEFFQQELGETVELPNAIYSYLENLD
jgi:hypothetical protein